MFLDRLNSISDRIAGSLALALVAGDGMMVESVASDPELDLEVLSAELLSQVASISIDQSELGAGTVEQFSVTTREVTILIAKVAEGYYLLLLLEHQGNYGKARFELRRARLELEDDLI